MLAIDLIDYPFKGRSNLNLAETDGERMRTPYMSIGVISEFPD
jgi:hypothetical protein